MIGGAGLIYYLVALIVVAIDQLSKWAVVQFMELFESIPVIEGWLHITSSRNTGAAFSILQNKQWFLIPLSILVIVFIIYYIYKERKNKLFSFSLALVLGGAVGNLIDRIITGSVVDFIDVRIINFAIFNIADSAITIGVTLLIIDIIFFQKKIEK